MGTRVVATEQNRVLIEIMTAANLAGVEQAQKSFLGLSASTLALAAGIAIVVTVGKAAVDNYKAQQSATLGLNQAVAAFNATHKQTPINQKALNDEVANWLELNKEYIPNQYDATAAVAQAVRAGNDQVTSMRIVNDALDLAVIKHESVSEATNTEILALAGNSRGLRDLGITTAQYNAIMKSKLSQQEKDAQLLTLIESKTKDGRKATEELDRNQQALNKDWQDFTVKIGPAVTGALDDIVKAADIGIQILTELWEIISAIIASPDKINTALKAIGFGSAGRGTHTTTSQPFGSAGRGRASGGPVDPGGVYTVGEHGPETLVMGSNSGTIIPNGGGRGVYIDLRGAFLPDGPSIDRLANLIARRLSYTTGR